MFAFKPERVNFDEELGRGATGSIYPYQKAPDDIQWVVKFIPAKDFTAVIRHMQEIVLGFSCDHPAIVPIKGYHVEESKPKGWHIYLKLPRMFKTLKHRFNEQVSTDTPFSEKQLASYLHTLARGLDYLHNKKIAHQDIKPSNILLDADGNLKISDIGIGRLIGDDETIHSVTDRAGNLMYSAPEVLTNSDLKKSDLFRADSWSLGLIMAELSLLETKLVEPFMSPIEKEETLKRRLSRLSGRYSKLWMDLISNLLQANTKKRLPMQQIKNILEKYYPDLKIAAKRTRKNYDSPTRTQTLEATKFLTSETRDFDDYDENELPNEGADFDDFDRSEPYNEINEFEDENDIDDDYRSQAQSQGQSKSRNKSQSQTPARRQNQNKNQNLNFDLDEDEDQNGPKRQKAGKLAEELKRSERVKNPEQNLERRRGETSSGSQKPLFSSNLDFTSMQKELDEKWKTFFKYQIDKQLFVETINYVRITDQNLEEFFKDCAKMLRLNTTNSIEILELDIKLKGCLKITDQGLMALASCLGNSFKTLQHLSIDLSSCIKITDHGLKDLATQIGVNMPALKYLSLDFSWCLKLTDQGLKVFATHLGVNIKNLKHLRLDFANCALLTDYGIKDLGAQIGINFTKLQILHLNFACCVKITDQGVRDLTSSIGSCLRGIKNLSLNFFRCLKITNNGVKDMAIHIGANLKVFQFLGFNFSGCEALTDQGLKDLALYIGSNIKILQHFALDFSACNKITDQGVKDLSIYIAPHLRTMHQLDLDFSWCEKITTQGRAILTKLCQREN